jgi:HEAT repeat protein
MNKLLAVAMVLALTGCAARSTGDWAAQLRSGNATERLHAIQALEDRGAEASVVVPALAEALNDENAFVRRDAARALGKVGPEARPAVAALLAAARKDRERSVRKAVAEALKKIDPAAGQQAGVR